MKKPVLLIILDGWGYSEMKEKNPIAEADTPCFDKLWQESPRSLLYASGEHVGLPEGQMGNSEVGHLTIGAGKTIDTDLVRISKAALNHEFTTNPAFVTLFNHIKEYESTLHIKGLLGPGGIHSHSDHLYAFLKAAKEFGITKIAIHAFTDGRDTDRESAHQYLDELQGVLDDLGIGFIATASGRFYAMDRDNNWDRLKKFEEAIFEGKGKVTKSKPSEVLKNLYDEGIFDEHIEPIVFLDENDKSYQINENDGVFFFNFRADRARMLSQRIAEKKKALNLCFVTMTEYDPKLECLVAFSPLTIETTLANEVSKAGLKQAHIAETEKFAHATYFLNGGRNEPYDNEKHVLIESRKDIDTYDKAPEMRCYEIARETVKFIDENETDFIFVNFANPDMVGHTANFEATRKAIEHTDSALLEVITEVKKKDGIAIITADHGNAELAEENGKKHTAHTTNLVPAILFNAENYSLKDGSLKDIAPTILDLLNLPKPKQMEGETLLKK